MDPLVERTGKGRIGDHDVEPFETRDPREQVPINGMQAIPIACAVTNRDDHVAPRARRRADEQLRAYRMLVDATRRRAAPLEFAERGSEKSRLPDQPLGAAIARRSAVEPPHRQPLEVIDRLLMALQRIEELEHRGDKARPDAKRRVRARFNRRAAGDRQQCFPFFGGVGHPMTNPLEQPFVELRARNEVGQDNRATRGHPVFDRSHQVERGGARGDDDETIAGVERRAVRGQRNQRISERPQIRRPHESGRAGSDHWSRGGSSSARISRCTRATMSIAPAADEEACHAMATSPDDTAL